MKANLTNLMNVTNLLNLPQDTNLSTHPVEAKSEAERSLWELKHLTYQRKINQDRDSLSSGERTGNSLNPVP